MKDPNFLFAHALTEPKGASDRWLGYNAPEAAMDTKAVKVDGIKERGMEIFAVPKKKILSWNYEISQLFFLPLWLFYTTLFGVLLLECSRSLFICF